MSKKIAKSFFKSGIDVQYESFFPTRRQFDSSSCGIWLLAGMASYVLNLPIPLQKQEVFEIAYSLVEHINDYAYVVEPETIPFFKLLRKFCLKQKIY